MNASDELQGITGRMGQYPIHIPDITGRRVILVDTPSFDRGTVDDAFEILRQISSWLASLYVIFYRLMFPE